MDRSLNTQTAFELGDVRIDPSALGLSRGDRTIRVEARAMQLLVYLAENAERVVSRDEIEADVWGGRIVSEDALTSAIAKLRRALGDDARHPRFIETVPKVGYRLLLQPLPLSPAADPSRQLQLWGNGKHLRWAAVPLVLVLSLAVIWMAYPLRKFLPMESIVPADKPSIAVLTFENLGPSENEDYFARGIADDLISDLAKVSSLSMTSSRSIDYYKRGNTNPRRFSAELKADYIVDGSVRRQGSKLRFNVQIIDGRSERILWGNRYDGTVDDVFGLQDVLVDEVLTTLRVRLTPREKASLARRPTRSIEAYDQYLQGIERQGRRSREENKAAKVHLKQAIELDPRFARAYAGLAMAHSRDAIDGWVEDPMYSLEVAKQLATKAAKIDASIPQVHFVMGQVELFRRRHLQAIEAANRATEIDPSFADAYALKAWILNYAGRSSQAQSAIQEAIRRAPRPTASYLEVLGEIQFVLGLYSDSAATFQQVLTINPSYMRARMWIVAARALAGDLEAAQWEVDELMVLSPEFDLDDLQFSFPFKDPRELDKFINGLETAGLVMRRVEKAKDRL